MKLVSTLATITLLLSSLAYGKSFADMIVDTVSDISEQAINDVISTISDTVVDILEDYQEEIDRIATMIESIIPEDASAELLSYEDVITDYFEHIASDLDTYTLPIKNTTCITRHCTT